jgi:arsenical-resistance protein 2
MVRSAINIPAHAFYPTRMNLVKVLGNIPLVIFYCSSSNGRGPRCAGWFQDTLNEVGNKESEALVLTGGIKSWVEWHSDLAEPLRHFPS